MLQFFETFNLQIAYNSNLISKFALLTKNEMSNKEPGYVYILTNPSFGEDYVKIAVEKSDHIMQNATRNRELSLYTQNLNY